MSKFTRVWDEESKKYVFKSAEEAPEANWLGGVYGEYVWCKDGDIEEAKANLLEQMIDTIREVAQKDEFWIVKKADASDPISMMGCPIDGVDTAYTVGWKIEIPHMMPVVNAAPAKKKPSIIIPVE